MKQVRAFSLMLLISSISLAGFSQSKDVAKLDKAVKPAKAADLKKQTGGIPFIVTSTTSSSVSCPGALNTFTGSPTNGTINQQQFPLSSNPFKPASVTCGSTPITCNGADFYCVLLIHPDDVQQQTINGVDYWVPIANARVNGCCYKN